MSNADLLSKRIKELKKDIKQLEDEKRELEESKYYKKAEFLAKISQIQHITAYNKCIVMTALLPDGYVITVNHGVLNEDAFKENEIITACKVSLIYEIARHEKLKDKGCKIGAFYSLNNTGW